MLRLVLRNSIFSLIVLGIFINDSKVVAKPPPHIENHLRAISHDPYFTHRTSGFFVWGGKAIMANVIAISLSHHTGKYLKNLGGMTSYVFDTNAPYPFLDFGASLTLTAGAVTTGYLTNMYMKGGFYISNFDRGYNIDPKLFDDTRRIGFQRLPWPVRVAAATSAAFGFVHIAPEVLRTCAKVVGMLVNTLN